jgi:hypothetical protein
MYRKYNKVEVNNQIFNLLVPIDEKDRCVVKTEDGNLEMPTFIIKFGE